MADTSGTLKSIERLKREKRNAKTRLTRERNKLYELLSTTKASKNTIRRYISKIKSEFLIIEKLLNKLKEMFIFESIPESETEVEQIEREIDEIGNQVDVIIEAAETHLKERLEGGELESIAPSGSTHSEYEIQQSETEAANKRVLTLQAEENQKEEELQRKAVELELAKQRTDEARKIVCIIDARYHNTTPKTAHDSDETCSHSQLPQQVPGPSTPLNEMDPNQLQPQQTLDPSAPPPETHLSHLQPQQVPGPSTPLNEMDPNQFTPQQTLDPSAPPPETHLSHLQPQQTLYPSTSPPATHPGHLQPQQTLDPSTSPPATHPGHLQPQQILDPSATAFTSSQSLQRPIPDPDLSDGFSSQGHPPQFPWQQTSKPVLNRYNPNTYQLHTQLPPPVLDSMSRYIPRQQPRIPYTWQPSPAAPSSKTPTSHRDTCEKQEMSIVVLEQIQEMATKESTATQYNVPQFPWTML
ncbi:Hypothetical predicted protein [Paramuricea clavata]|uniref:Uncharacterized protein n=1 Tax=Paramuricea clavata TaxID=317549 RepID=A0A7D9HEX6_PARCT|nr:Hypothetical predicted protein [Paramuricea clavata]